MNKTNNKGYFVNNDNVMTGKLHTDPVLPSLRTAAAIAAMQGILASGEKSSEVIISESVYLADALLTELNKPKDESKGN